MIVAPSPRSKRPLLQHSIPSRRTPSTRNRINPQMLHGDDLLFQYLRLSVFLDSLLHLSYLIPPLCTFMPDESTARLTGLDLSKVSSRFMLSLFILLHIVQCLQSFYVFYQRSDEAFQLSVWYVVEDSDEVQYDEFGQYSSPTCLFVLVSSCLWLRSQRGFHLLTSASLYLLQSLLSEATFYTSLYKYEEA